MKMYQTRKSIKQNKNVDQKLLKKKLYMLIRLINVFHTCELIYKSTKGRRNLTS